MIETLSGPAVCVVDDERKDFEPLLRALQAKGIWATHFDGENLEDLPPRPFETLRLVFQDLHLDSGAGGNRLERAVAVFLRLVSPRTAPTVVVVWSKFARENEAGDELPVDDEDREFCAFRRKVLEAEPKYKHRLIFVEMEKPKHGAPERERDQQWTEFLSRKLDALLDDHQAMRLLWAAEAAAREAASGVASRLGELAIREIDGTDSSFDDGLRRVLHAVVHAQNEGALSPDTALHHLRASLGPLIVDHLEQAAASSEGAPAWLTDAAAVSDIKSGSAELNGVFLASLPPRPEAVFVPGTVFKIGSRGRFSSHFGASFETVLETLLPRPAAGPKRDRFDALVRTQQPQVVALELTPSCDAANGGGKRHTAVMLAGLIVQRELWPFLRKGDAWLALPAMQLQGGANVCEGAFKLALCSRFRGTVRLTVRKHWVTPVFRLRSEVMASIRNWHSGQLSRAGYVSFAGEK